MLHLSGALTEDTAYTVQVSAVLDLVGNNINNGGTNNPAPFRTWMSGPGNGLLFEVYDTGGGVTVDLLTNSPVYPDAPFVRTNLWAFDSRLFYPDDTQGGYGTRTRGVFIPPVSGDWVFFLRTFDRGVVYFNPDGLAAAGKQQILAEVTGNNPRDWDKFISTTFHLKAGQGYYIEALQKADVGMGADVIKVAARLVGTGFPPLGIPDAMLDTNALSGPAVGWPFVPRDLGGPLTIVQQPANLSAEATHLVTFSVQVSNPSGLPVFYKWFRGGSEIPGATGPSYTFQAARTDDGATFSVQASKLGSEVTSRTATLRVVPDTTSPTVIGVESLPALDSVILTFSERVNPDVARDSFNYMIIDIGVNIGVITAVPDANGSNVVLTLGPALTAGVTYTMSIDTVEDLAQNVIVTTNVTFRAWAPSLTISQNAGLVRVSWPLSLTGFQLYQTSSLSGTPPSWTLVPPASYLTDATSTYIEIPSPTGTVFYVLQGQP